MYLPKSKYKKFKHTVGGEFVYKSNRSTYSGYYFETYEKRFFTGKEPDDLCVELLYTVGDSPPIKFEFNSKSNHPTQEDRNRGYFIRYFLRDSRNNRLIEVTKELFLEFSKESYIFGTSLSWVLKGPVEDINVGKYTYQGAESKNKETIETEDKKLPGLKNYISDYKEFVE